jgi:hypothetical protein
MIKKKSILFFLLIKDDAEEEDEIDERTKEELKEPLHQFLQLGDEGRLISYKNRIQMYVPTKAPYHKRHIS